MRKRFAHLDSSMTKEEALEDIWQELKDLMNEGDYVNAKEIYITIEGCEEEGK